MNKLLAGLLVLSLTLTGASAAIGQGNTQQRTPIEFSSARGQAIKTRCTAIVERFETVSQAIQAGQTRSFDLQTKLLDSLGKFSNQAKSSDIDVSSLDQHISQMSNLSGQLSTAWQSAITALNTDEQKIDCAAADFDPEDLHKAIEAAKISRDELRTHLSSLIELMNGEIKTELARIRGQLEDRQ